MRILSLEVSNFRAIEYAKLEGLSDMVVIAGPNGCGKSCLFDAIRLLKSAYGGYNPNEWQLWFSEFQINLSRNRWELLPLFRNRELPIRIRAAVKLADSEKAFLRSNAREVLEPRIWEQVAPGGGRNAFSQGTAVAEQLRAHQPKVEERLKAEIGRLLRDLENETFTGELTIHPTTSIEMAENPTLETVYSLFVPEVGVFDYHGAQRNYAREEIGGVNLNIDSEEKQRTQHALYNYANKYQNIKSQMAGAFIRDEFAKLAGKPVLSRESLIETLKELFRLFFPGKEFLGPQPTQDGKLLFPVRIGGIEHDINDLSSGEKEVLYGYLRIRNAGPKNSVLLLDEPELHLNPRLIRGLPQFYHRHIGRHLDNQIWLLTHSDMLLKESLGQEGFSVFHMLPAGGATAKDNQLKPIGRDQAVEQALLDLVGEVAAYQPGAKVVIFEGGGDSDFDANLTGELFPDFLAAVNTISGTNKRRVRELHVLLQEASERGALPGKFYSIVDKDSEGGEEQTPASWLKWDVYHIENYLLEPKFIRAALQDALRDRALLKTDLDVSEALRRCAAETIGLLVKADLETWANRAIVDAIKTGCDPAGTSLAPSLRASIEGSLQRVSTTATNVLALQNLQERERKTRQVLEEDLETDKWRTTYRGRDVLKRFVQKHGAGIAYEVFRNLIIAKMRDAAFQPNGMKVVIEKILRD